MFKTDEKQVKSNEFQTSSLSVYVMTCDACKQIFYEFEPIADCPHCGALIEKDNLGSEVEIKYEINTKTGEVSRI